MDFSTLDGALHFDHLAEVDSPQHSALFVLDVDAVVENDAALLLHHFADLEAGEVASMGHGCVEVGEFLTFLVRTSMSLCKWK